MAETVAWWWPLPVVQPLIDSAANAFKKSGPFFDAATKYLSRPSEAASSSPGNLPELTATFTKFLKDSLGPYMFVLTGVTVIYGIVLLSPALRIAWTVFGRPRDLMAQRSMMEMDLREREARLKEQVLDRFASDPELSVIQRQRGFLVPDRPQNKEAFGPQSIFDIERDFGDIGQIAKTIEGGTARDCVTHCAAIVMIARMSEASLTKFAMNGGYRAIVSGLERYGSDPRGDSNAIIAILSCIEVLFAHKNTLYVWVSVDACTVLVRVMEVWFGELQNRPSRERKFEVLQVLGKCLGAIELLLDNAVGKAQFERNALGGLLSLMQDFPDMLHEQVRIERIRGNS